MSASSPTKLSEGQPVRVIPRPASSDARGTIYYDFYEGLTGTIAKLYADGTVSVMVDKDSMPEAIRERHEKQEHEMQDKWLRGLSEEDRGRLTDKQREFTLRYTVLLAPGDVAPGDVAPVGATTPKKATPKSETASVAEQPARRRSSAEIAADEKRHLDELKKRASG